MIPHLCFHMPPVISVLPEPGRTLAIHLLLLPTAYLLSVHASHREQCGLGTARGQSATSHHRRPLYNWLSPQSDRYSEFNMELGLSARSPPLHLPIWLVGPVSCVLGGGGVGSSKGSLRTGQGGVPETASWRRPLGHSAHRPEAGDGAPLSNELMRVPYRRWALTGALRSWC